MNKVVNNFLLARDTFMPALHLRKPVFTFRAVDRLIHILIHIPKLKETGV